MLMLLLAADKARLELPQLVVTGRYEAQSPTRAYWPSPELTSGVWLTGSGVPMPQSEQEEGKGGGYVPSRSLPPAGFSFTVAYGPRRSGWLVAGIGEPGGGVAVWGWSSHGEKVDRAGARATAFAGGSWGRITVCGQRREDRFDGQDLAPGWTQGMVTLALPLGGHRMRLSAYTSSAENDDIHAKAEYGGIRIPSGGELFFVGSDRQAGGTVRWQSANERLETEIGSSWMKAHGKDLMWLVGKGSVQLISQPHLGVRLSGQRSLSLLTRSHLRTLFPLLMSEQDAEIQAVAWQLNAEGSARLASDVVVTCRVGGRRVASAPAWRQRADSLHWEAMILSGQGPIGSLEAQWAWSHDLEFSAGIMTDRLEVTETEGLVGKPWPVRSRTRWWVGARMAGRPSVHCRIHGRGGMETVDGHDIASMTTVSWQVVYPLSKGWQAWMLGSLGDGWEYSPVPNRMVSVGLGWSLKGVLQ